ncbi:UvrB/UvrC motif-containing protein [Natribacillus halophilus]|uniref:Protein-arginine kinase activator protein McsA n=1 Tax=Natribacillus halophilus TaxID=549003 RepID=A0A1G8QYK4_9BACI|nr:UvrB/UvrC motif-containing protein [Natribacillus halophilus]SDJ09778.1 Protein-arginine kinase activator protein McsA [Natribacillus halophilus]
MQCQECNHRQATLHFTKIVNAKKTEMHLCEVCAKEKGDELPGSNSYSIHDLLSGLLNLDPSMGAGADYAKHMKQEEVLRCQKCGLFYKDFVKNSRFGCSHCYQAFSANLDPILKRVHGGNHTHTGKIPKRQGGRLKLQKEVLSLKEKMQKHIDNEEFELAADVRDRIRELEETEEKKGDQ